MSNLNQTYAKSNSEHLKMLGAAYNTSAIIRNCT